jgi:hypothetical protein
MAKDDSGDSTPAPSTRRLIDAAAEIIGKPDPAAAA